MNLLPIVLLTATVAATPYIPADDLKCGRTERTAPHYIVDGVFLGGPDAPEGSVTPDVRAADVARIDVLCWDPVRRVLQKGSGEPAVLVLTKQFMAALHDDLERIVAAQDAFRAEHGRFTGEFHELQLKPATPGIDIIMSRSETGWHATAGGDLLTISCQVYAGAVTPPVESLVEREPACSTLPQFTR